MKSSEILHEIKELREAWRRQAFVFTPQQQIAFDKLLQLRRERVKYFYDNDLVWKGPSKAGSANKQIKVLCLMKTFNEFIAEVYDPEVQGRSQIRKQGEWESRLFA